MTRGQKRRLESKSPIVGTSDVVSGNGVHPQIS